MNGAALLALQVVDTAIDAIANRRPRLSELAARREAAAAVDQLRARMADADRVRSAAEGEIDSAEAATAAVTAKRARLEAQLKRVIAPREAEALMTEIAVLDAERGEIDERELAAMEAQAAAESSLAELAALEPALIAALAEAERVLADANGVLDAELDALGAQRAVAAAALSTDELSAYDAARRQFGGVGVAALEGHRCNGCHLDLSATELDVVRSAPAGEPGECPHCGRFLVR